MASTVAVLGTLIACTAACLDSDARSAEISDSTAAAASLATARVTTASGPVQGIIASDLAIFRGIPYAAPPTGLRRFAPPVPPAPWSSPRPAIAFGAACAALAAMGIAGE